MLTCGIVGLPLAGKTTLFNLLTHTAGKKVAHGSVVGTAPVPDSRVDRLSELYQPRKTTYSQIQLTDIAGLSQGTGKTAAFLDSIRSTQVLIHIIRAFRGELPHPFGEIDPIRDFEMLNYELLLADLAMVEKYLDRIKSGGKLKGQQKELVPLLERCQEHLASEKPMTAFPLGQEEADLLQGFTFFTSKPQLVAVNLDEKDLGATPSFFVELSRLVEAKGWQILALSASIESEIALLDAREQASFMEELGIVEAGSWAVARQSYSLLGLISFFTVGKDEVRAWAIRKGKTVLDAAAVIHTDLARGFIRADVMKTDDLLAAGSEAAVKEKGLAQLVGKDYLVQDGDIIHIRFNV